MSDNARPYRQHEPGVVWSLRDPRSTPVDEYVRTIEGGIAMRVGGTYITVDRMTARLLARRINECLEATTRPSRKGSGEPS